MQQRSGHPEGAGHGWPAFSDRAMDGESENGDGTAYPLSGFDVTRKAVFFGHFLLGQQKKVPRPQGRTVLILKFSRKRSKTFRLKASYLL